MFSAREVEYDFEGLNVYREAYCLTREVYQATKGFPRDEQFGIVSQLKRAALSIVLNIAEGSGRNHIKVFIQFLYQSRGSLFEAMTLIKLSHEFGLLESPVAEQLLDRTDKISAYLNNLIKVW